MANIKSAKKRILVTATRTARNKSIRSAVTKNKEEAQAALSNAVSTIGKATQKGVYHKNNAARKVSRLTRLVNEI